MVFTFGAYDVGSLSELCHSCFPSFPQAVPTEAASERRGEAPTEAQLHSARLTGEANIKRTDVWQFIRVNIGSFKLYKIY